MKNYILFAFALVAMVVACGNATYIEMRSTDDIIHKKLFPAINKGKFYTGDLVPGSLAATKLGLLETDVVLKREKEDTILEFASTITFDRLNLNSLEIPGAGTNNYVVRSKCNMGPKGGIRISMKLAYDMEKAQFEDADNNFKIHCVGNDDIQPFSIKLSKNQGKDSSFFDRLRGKVLSGIANLGIKHQDSFVIKSLEDMALDLLLDEVNKEVTNPWARYTTNSLRKRGVTEAGPDSLSYILYQILQQHNSIKVVTANSPLLHLGPQVTGKDKCLFKPVVTLQNFKYDQVTLKVNSYYHQKDPAKHGAHRVMFDFNGLQTEIKHAFVPKFIGKRILGALELNDERIATRENYESQWKCSMEDGSAINEWATAKVLNIVLPPKDVPREKKSMLRRVSGTARKVFKNVGGFFKDLWNKY